MKTFKIILPVCIALASFGATGTPLYTEQVFFKMQGKNEIWKDIIEMESFYSVSNYGRIVRKSRPVKTKGGERNLKERYSKLQNNGRGYLALYVKINGKRTLLYIHRLVAMYFLENPFKLPEVNHKDGNKSNNNVDNLEWITREDNQKHASENNLIKKGEACSYSKLNKNDVLAIRRLYRMNPGFNKCAVARKLNVRDTTIHKIINNQRWKSI